MASPGPISVADEDAKYPYMTLKGPHSFRLLLLVTAPKRSDTISCIMQEFDRDSVECPPYTALSYAWGDASNEKQILLDNLLVPVTANPHEALMHLRDGYADITIWIDALCINQDSLRERGHQFAQMKEIYSEAEDVISWLGPSSEETGRAVAAARGFQLNDSEAFTSILQRDAKARSHALESLMNRPYWGRVWTVREMAVATNLSFMCGSDTVRCEDFIKYFWRFLLY